MKDNNKSMRKGFTLIELLVVLGILGILATVLLVAINPSAQLQKANDAHRKSDLETIQRALELYYQDKGSYPPSLNNQIAPGNVAINWGSSWQPYISILPKDPSSGDTYVYYSPASAGGQAYYLYANLQRGMSDPQACNKGNACQSLSGVGFPSSTACGGTCSYGVSSPNVSP